MIITRQEFIDKWNRMVPADPVDRPDHPLWIPETEIKRGPRGEWFILQQDQDMVNDEYWKWCDENLAGLVRCYLYEELQDGDWAWWGFTEKKDIFLWMLRWS